MTFVEWYKNEYKKDWSEDAPQVGSFRDIVRDEYLEYCSKNKIEPKFKQYQ